MHDIQGLVDVPAHAVPHKPLAPWCAVAPFLGELVRKGHGQPILVRVVNPIDQLHGRMRIDLMHHRHALAHSKKASDVKAVLHRIGHIPALGFFCRGLQDDAGLGPSLHDGLRSMVGILPARFVAIWPDQDVLARQRGPVGFLNWCVGAVHGRGGAHTQINQCLCALLTFHHHDLLGLEHARLVVQRTRLRWSHLAAAHIPWPELLAARLWVVAVHHGDEFSAGILVIPLGCCRSQLIHCRGFGFARGHRADGHSRDSSEPAFSPFEHLGKLGLHIEVVVAGDEVEDVSALTRGAVGPQPDLLTREQKLQAVARPSHHIAHQVFVLAALS